MAFTADDALVDASMTAAAATAIPPGPPPSSETPGPVQEPPGQSGSATGELRPDPPREFDARYREPFTGLLYLGYLEHRFELWGHSFLIQTPSMLERLQVGVVHKPYADSMASEIAMMTVVTAAFLREVDGTPLPEPVLTNPRESALADRFRWVAANLRSPVVNRIWERCLVLDDEVAATMEALGEA